MLRGNLSSRPFYNERLVTLIIGMAAVLAIALTAFNGYKIYALSRHRSELKSRIATETAQAQEIERQALALQKNINRTTLAKLAISTEEANSLIDQRTFSWTAFFGLLEKTLPFDLRLISVAPRIDRGNIQVIIRVVAKKIDDIDAFVDALQNTGSFYNPLPRNIERIEDDNTFTGDIVTYYLAPNHAVPAPTKKGTPPGKGRR